MAKQINQQALDPEAPKTAEQSSLVDGNQEQTEWRNDIQPHAGKAASQANKIASEQTRRNFIEQEGQSQFGTLKKKRKGKSKGGVWDFEAILSQLQGKMTAEAMEALTNDLNEALDDFRENGADVTAASATEMLHDLHRLLEGHSQSAELVTSTDIEDTLKNIASQLEAEGYKQFSPEFVEDFLRIKAEAAANAKEADKQRQASKNAEKLDAARKESERLAKLDRAQKTAENLQYVAYTTARIKYFQHNPKNWQDRSDAWEDIIKNAPEILRNELRDIRTCLLYTSPSPRDKRQSRMPSSA